VTRWSCSADTRSPLEPQPRSSDAAHPHDRIARARPRRDLGANRRRRHSGEARGRSTAPPAGSYSVTTRGRWRDASLRNLGAHSPEWDGGGGDLRETICDLAETTSRATPSCLRQREPPPAAKVHGGASRLARRDCSWIRCSPSVGHPSASPSGDDFHRSVVVAMILVRMMESSVHQIADVITVRDGFMTAIGTMHVTSVGTGTTFRHDIPASHRRNVSEFATDGGRHEPPRMDPP
jgi:hypothetical protein